MKKINRRKFIVNTAEATAGAALAFTILEGSASGTSLNGTIRVAVVGVNGRGGRKLVEAARRHSRVVQHGTQMRSSKALNEAIQKLREGVIGKVYMAKGLCYKWRNTIGRTQESPVPPGVNYDMWLGPAPQR